MNNAIGRLSVSVCAVVAATWSAAPARAAIIQPGTYRLHNHPDGEAATPFYGLRLDELFNVTSGHDIFTFSFDHADSAVFMDWDGASTLHIYGTAFGGHDIGAEYSPSPARTSLVTFDFTYTTIHPAAGDDDLIVTTPSLTNVGTLTWVDTGEVINLWDKANVEGYTFRLGDENNDLGHRGFTGLSGWGWLNHHNPNVHVSASDWLFTAELIPGPPALVLLAMGVAISGRRRRSR